MLVGQPKTSLDIRPCVNQVFVVFFSFSLAPVQWETGKSISLFAQLLLLLQICWEKYFSLGQTTPIFFSVFFLSTFSFSSALRYVFFFFEFSFLFLAFIFIFFFFFLLQKKPSSIFFFYSPLSKKKMAEYNSHFFLLFFFFIVCSNTSCHVFFFFYPFSLFSLLNSPLFPFFPTQSTKPKNYGCGILLSLLKLHFFFNGSTLLLFQFASFLNFITTVHIFNVNYIYLQNKENKKKIICSYTMTFTLHK